MNLRLKPLLKEKKMTLTDVANNIGWSPQKMHSRLKAKNISITTIEEIAKGLGVEIHEMFYTSKDYAHFYDNGEWLGIRKKY